MEEVVIDIGKDMKVVLNILKGDGSEGIVAKVARHDNFIVGITGGIKIIGMMIGSLGTLSGIIYGLFKII